MSWWFFHFWKQNNPVSLKTNLSQLHLYLCFGELWRAFESFFHIPLWNWNFSVEYKRFSKPPEAFPLQKDDISHFQHSQGKENKPKKNFFSQGDHGIKHQVYLSLPCVLTSNGITHVVKQILTKDEEEKLQASADLMNTVLQDLKFWHEL